MATVKQHYDQHLGNFYSWMAGDLQNLQGRFQDFLLENNLTPKSTKIAIDLGAGHGVQSIPLARTGYTVYAVDFNRQLLSELAENSKGLNVEIIHSDIRKLERFAGQKPELIVCCGDTIAHLDSMQDISIFISDICRILTDNGNMVLTFRDYSKELSGEERVIPVKSDNSRILTCILDYKPEHINVTDLLHEKTENGWVQKVSTYKKVRITTQGIAGLLEKNGMNIQLNEIRNGLTTISANNK